MRNRNQIVGVFHTEQDAIKAIEGLKAIGYRSEEISVISRNKDDMNDIREETGTKAPEGVAAGAATGGILGGVAGLLAGIGLLAIPGIGPLLAAGPIAATLTGAAAGAGAGGLAGGLIGLGIPEDEAKRYDTYVKDNKLLVMVEADDARRARVYELFRTYGSLNADTYGLDTKDGYANAVGSDRAVTGRTDWTADATGAAAGVYDRDIDEELNRTGADTVDRNTLRLKEERLDVDKERVRTGEVTLRKEVVEEEKSIQVPVQREEVVIERRPVNEKAVDGTDIGADETIRVPVSEERVQVTKTPVVTEEISAGKRVVRDTEQVSDTVRKERAEVEREGTTVVNDDRFSTSRSNRR